MKEIGPARKRIGIIGIGPVGGILAAHLARAGEDVVIVDILKGHLEEIRRNGLRVSGEVDINATIPKTCEDISELKDHDVDLLFAAVKAPILSRIVPRIKAAVREDTQIISYQNGLDTELMFGEQFDTRNVHRVVVNYAGVCMGKGHVKMTFFNGPNYIGPLAADRGEVSAEIAAMMTSASLRTEYTPNIRGHVWEKVILNSALSPLCAVTGRTMRDVMESPDTFALVVELLREAISVAEADGYDFDDGFLDRCIMYLKKAGNHKPSMLVDLECRRTTEIDFLNCKIINYGKKYRLATPYNDFVTRLVKSTECLYLRPPK